ncbi:MAG TPA: glutamine-hydrolyzing carbamoyl-phosphate synthase small subunit [Acidimicrobiia bacterium]|nr:glutamine-hydrolyzing carbamoyl-phosphate synthase small subunit [Acidimicrobiia bacterium]
MRREGVLVLADGAVFEGELAGAAVDVATGELIFNTALSGYQEIITDPSYAGQMITFTYPHIGNYGVNRHDDESRRPFCQGIVVRDLAPRASNWRAEGDLDAFLGERGVPAITGIDTRRLTRHLRDTGVMPGAFGAEETAVCAAAERATGTDGLDLVAGVTVDEPYTVGDPDAPFRVVAYDYGIKTTILRHLASAGCVIEVVPASTPAADVIARDPDGVFLSNGPGDPAAVAGAADIVAALIGELPLFGICLGHQIMGLALGAETTKLAFGHHGANHPVRNEATGRVEITSQNHNYVVQADTVGGGADVTHVNLNDGTVEGLRVRGVPAFSVQHHPEAAPGPHDAAYLFGEFTELMTAVGAG